LRSARVAAPLRFACLHCRGGLIATHPKALSPLFALTDRRPGRQRERESAANVCAKIQRFAAPNKEKC